MNHSNPTSGGKNDYLAYYNLQSAAPNQNPGKTCQKCQPPQQMQPADSHQRVHQVSTSDPRQQIQHTNPYQHIHQGHSGHHPMSQHQIPSGSGQTVHHQQMSQHQIPSGSGQTVHHQQMSQHQVPSGSGQTVHHQQMSQHQIPSSSGHSTQQFMPQYQMPFVFQIKGEKGDPGQCAPSITGNKGDKGEHGVSIKGEKGTPGNPAVSPLASKGDIFAFSTVNDRLPLGQDGSILRANSGTTHGLDYTGHISIDPNIGNVFLGPGAGISTQEGLENTGIGFGALGSLKDGHGNVGYGFNAGSGIVDGNGNTILGHFAGTNLIGEDSYNIVVGPVAGVSGSNQTFIDNIFGTNIGGGISVAVSVNDQLGINTSSRQFKENISTIRNNKAVLDKLLSLDPVIFNYKDDHTKALQFGLVAEDVYQVFPELVFMKQDMKRVLIKVEDTQKQNRDIVSQTKTTLPFDNKMTLDDKEIVDDSSYGYMKIPTGNPYPWAVRYEQIIPLLLAQIMKQQQKITQLENQITSLGDAQSKVTQKITQLENQITSLSDAQSGLTQKENVIDNALPLPINFA